MNYYVYLVINYVLCPEKFFHIFLIFHAISGGRSDFLFLFCKIAVRLGPLT